LKKKKKKPPVDLKINGRFSLKYFAGADPSVLGGVHHI
jgi:hypothetical protein